MSSLDMSPAAISGRLAKASELSNLDAGRRLEAKIDLSPAAIEARLRTVSELRDLCAYLARAKKGDRS